MSEQCVKIIFTNRLGGQQCANSAKVKDGAKWHCTLHSDASIAKRKAKKEAKWKVNDQAWHDRNAEKHEQKRRADCYETMLAALEACAEVLEHLPLPGNDQDLRDTVATTWGTATEAIAAAKGEEDQDART